MIKLNWKLHTVFTSDDREHAAVRTRHPVMDSRNSRTSVSDMARYSLDKLPDDFVLFVIFFLNVHLSKRCYYASSTDAATSGVSFGAVNDFAYDVVEHRIQFSLK